MSFDTLIMKTVTDELQGELSGTPVQKVYETELGEILIHLFSRGNQPGLLFSTDSNYARTHLTEKRPHKKELPSPFCMLLRKYLVGGRAASFSNPHLERILEIKFDPPEGLRPVKLIAEIMNRRSNLILVNDEGIILGAAKTVSGMRNPKRVIMPGEKYKSPPAQDKLDPIEMELEQFTKNLHDCTTAGLTPEKALLNVVNGVSPLTARELLFRAKWDHKDIAASCQRLFHEVKKLFYDSSSGNLQPVLLPNVNIYAAMPLFHLAREKQVAYDSTNRMLDQFYTTLISKNLELALKEKLGNAVKKRLTTLEKKRQHQNEELQAASKASQHRLYGELLLAYKERVPKGAESVVLPDLYNPEDKVTVPLNPSKTVSTNAQNHFNRYRKAKSGQQKIKKQLNKTKTEIEYCRELLYTIETNSAGSLEEIRQEMIEAGFLREKKKTSKKKDAVPQPQIFKTSSGRTIMVGRNNRQNDYITFKASVRRDTWFHVKNIPGSHVVLKETPYPPPPQDVEEAAFLAAYYSKGRESSAAVVDYTEVKHVRRRPGGKPGFVFYDNYETITVNPQDENLQKLFGLL